MVNVLERVLDKVNQLAEDMVEVRLKLTALETEFKTHIKSSDARNSWSQKQKIAFATVFGSAIVSIVITILTL